MDCVFERHKITICHHYISKNKKGRSIERPFYAICD